MWMYNRLVGPRVGNLRKSVVVLLAVLAGCSELVAAQFSIGAMACCVRSHHECAGLRTPDDCCRTMGRGIGASTSTAPSARESDIGLTLAVIPVPAVSAAAGALRLLPDPTFKRPHDPPHLHPVALLI
jgi:hypothetical protein